MDILPLIAQVRLLIYLDMYTMTNKLDSVCSEEHNDQHGAKVTLTGTRTNSKGNIFVSSLLNSTVFQYETSLRLRLDCLKQLFNKCSIFIQSTNLQLLPYNCTGCLVAFRFSKFVLKDFRF